MVKSATVRLWHGAALVVVITLAALSLATAQTADEDWPDDSARALAVNEGELRFIDPEEGECLHADTEIELDNDSKRNGWVNKSQCYRNLDTIAKTEITWAYREISDLRVTRSDNVGTVEVGRRSLLLHDVRQGATICVSARVKSCVPWPTVISSCDRVPITAVFSMVTTPTASASSCALRVRGSGYFESSRRLSQDSASSRPPTASRSTPGSKVSCKSRPSSPKPMPSQPVAGNGFVRYLQF